MDKYIGFDIDDKKTVDLTFEVSGQAGWLYDELVDLVDSLTVSNPSKMTWIYRTAKKLIGLMLVNRRCCCK